MLHLKCSGFSEKQLTALRELTELCAIVPDEAAAHTLTIFPGEPCLQSEGGDYRLTYSDPQTLWRLLSQVKSGLSRVTEQAHDGLLCYMCDESRNAVTTVATTKNILRYLAVMGYNSMMLYTEDTYAVEGYPAFGAMRGRYSEAELKALDDYADLFGIELIPCIQTLAHLETALRHKQFTPLKDTANVLLTGSEPTYDFLRACMQVCKRCFRSKRINIGMDEATELGLGAALKRDGYIPATERMLRHLERVVALCKELGYQPMMWSDMFFRMAFDGQYYTEDGEISAEIRKKVPKEVALVYWDYYTTDRKLFEHMVDCHQQFDNEVIFAGGAWKWGGYAPNNRYSILVSKMQLAVCKAHKLKNIIITAWGDNGAEASQYSAFAAMLYDAEACYHAEEPTEELLDRRSRECFTLPMEAMMTLDAPDELPKCGVLRGRPHDRPCNPHKYLLYNDPILGLMDHLMDAETVSAAYAENAKRLARYESNERFGYVFATLARLCELLSDKATLSIDLRSAYKRGDKAILRKAAGERIPRIEAELSAFLAALQTQWYKENKPFGIEGLELRLGGLAERVRTAKARLDAYLSGTVEELPELTEEPVPFDGSTAEKRGTPYYFLLRWTPVVTPGTL